jgi:ABC-2 type transport system ATP-binding protein
MGSLDALKAQLPGHDLITLTVAAASGDMVDHLATLPFVHQVLPEDDHLRVFVDNGAQNLPSLIDAVEALGGKVRAVSLHEQSLEDVFIHYTGKSIRAEEAKKVSMLIGAGIPQQLGR